LAAGYALGALTPEETRAFETAMAASPDLAREVAEYREVNALLAYSATRPPQASVKERLLRQVSAAKTVPLRRPATRPWLVPALTVAAAAAAIVAVTLDRRVGALQHELDAREVRLAATEAKLERRETTLNTLLTAEADLEVVQLTTTGVRAPGIQFFWNKRANMGVLHAFRLPPVPAGKVYQLWLIRGGKPIPSTTFNSESDGHALVQAFSLPAGGEFEAAAITVEPEGGSTTPTMPIVLLGKA
jgi:anti-sigma-K factor RskA